MRDRSKNTLKTERRINRIHMLLLKTIFRFKDGRWRAEYIKKYNILHHMGDNCYFQPTSLPADGCLVSIQDNVRVAMGVVFVTHDIFSQMFNESSEYRKYGKYVPHFAPIEIKSDVCIGGGGGGGNNYARR